MHPIYIPSRHRPECQTAKLLAESGILFRIVVEPHDVKNYESWKTGSLLVLPEDHQGIGYARGFIKTFSTQQGEPYCWQMDDDISGFLRRVPGKKTEKLSPRSVIDAIEKMTADPSIGIVGCDQNAWPPGKVQVCWDDLPVQAFLINNRVRANYRRIKLMSDFDFVLQAAQEGWATVRRDDLRTVTPGGHTRNGGLREVYAAEKAGDSARELLSYWKIPHKVRSDGRYVLQRKRFLRYIANMARLTSPKNPWD